MMAFIMDSLGYLGTAVVATIALGIVWYAAEVHVITHIYRYLYDVFHRTPMPAGEKRGLIYGRPTAQKWRIVGILSVIQSMYMIWAGHANPVVETFAAIAEIPAFLFGFAIGAMVHPRLVGGKYLEKFERMGDTIGTMKADDVKAQAKGAVGGVVGKGLSFGAWLKTAILGSTPDARPTPTPTPEVQVPREPEPELPKIDGRSAIDRYTRRSS